MRKPKFCWPLLGLQPLPDEVGPEMNPLPIIHPRGEISFPPRFPHCTWWEAAAVVGRAGGSKGLHPALHPTLPMCFLLLHHHIQAGPHHPHASQATASNLQSAVVSLKEEFNLQKSISWKNGMGQDFGASWGFHVA